MSVAKELYLQKLKVSGNSNTAARSAIFEALLARDHQPLTMSELIRAVGGQADRASIYRGVSLLEEVSIINRLQIGWKYKLELSDDFHGHHHHITCNICGETHATHDDEDFEQFIKSLTAKHGYVMTEHQLNIQGVCSKCQKKNPAV